jgi:hypothetical protein
MATELLLAACVLIALAGVVWFGARRLRYSCACDDDWLPRQLRASQLVYAERLFRSKGAIRIAAKVDRAYRDRTGKVTLVELKTRAVDKVYLSDIIELSAQRIALAAVTGEIVCAQGYVLVQLTASGGRRAHRVDLLTESQVAVLMMRREAILSGAIEARCASSPTTCRNCAFVETCWLPRPPTV